MGRAIFCMHPARYFTCEHHEGLVMIVMKTSGRDGTLHVGTAVLCGRLSPGLPMGKICAQSPQLSRQLQVLGAPFRRRSAHLHLGLHNLGLLGAVGDEGEAADTLAVEAHVLGVRLRAAHEVAVLQEHPDRLRVPRAVPARKALPAKQH